MINVVVEVYEGNSKVDMRPFTLDLDGSDIKKIKSEISKKMNIKKGDILNDGFIPEKDIKYNVRYWIELEKK